MKVSSLLIAASINYPSAIHAQQTASTDLPLTVTSTSTPKKADTLPPAQPKFNFVGPGFCLDSNHELYSGILTFPVIMKLQLGGIVLSQAFDCSTWCTRNPDNLRGFSYDIYSGACYCDYEQGQLPNPLPAGSTPLEGIGSGPITSSTGDVHLGCYMYPTVSPTPSCNKSTKKVKLESTTGEPIQIYELEAYTSSGTNVAINGSAIQSSTFKDSPTFVADNAIDGNQATFSHTSSGDANPYLEIVLAATTEIDNVRIINRWCGNPSDEYMGVSAGCQMQSLLFMMKMML